MTGTVLLLAGPAGAGKTTLARSWCGTREVAAHVEVEAVGRMLRQGRVDPRDGQHPGRPVQWLASVRAACAAARAFAESGIDVVVDDVLRPSDARSAWEPLLRGLPVHLVALMPSLRTCLERGAVAPEALVRVQYEACRRWEHERQLDTTGMGVEESVAALLRLLEHPASAWPGAA